MGCARFYMQGQRVGDAPVFGGMCANCIHLRYGPVNSNTASTGNKFTGNFGISAGRLAPVMGSPVLVALASERVAIICPRRVCLGCSDKLLELARATSTEAAVESSATSPAH